tara:strand:+ start:3227 stop:4807 length:1581 start_codon:yes stop_codon:yes gene_type:complete
MPKSAIIHDHQFTDGFTISPEIAPGTEIVEFANCKSLTSLPVQSIPAGVKQIIFRNCAQLKVIDQLPAEVEVLRVINCRNLQVTPDHWPLTIKEINISGSSQLQQILGPLPDGITKLHLRKCPNLSQLPEFLPTSLSSVSLDGCSKLEYSFQLIKRLNEVKYVGPGAALRLPEHFPPIGWLLEKIEADFKGSCDAISPYNLRNIKGLFSRFANEARRVMTIKDILDSSQPIIELFSQEPSHLIWADRIAQFYLQGCVNQPIHGWLEIAGYANVAMQSNFADKINASKQILARNLVSALVTEMPGGSRPDPDYETEFANAMMRHLHERLQSKDFLSVAWLGIPERVPQEVRIDGKITSELIDRFEGLVISNVLALDSSQIIAKITATEDEKSEAWLQAMASNDHEISTQLQIIESSDRHLLEFLQFLSAIEDRSAAAVMESLSQEEPDRAIIFKSIFEQQDWSSLSDQDLQDRFQQVKDRQLEVKIDFLQSKSKLPEIAQVPLGRPSNSNLEQPQGAPLAKRFKLKE